MRRAIYVVLLAAMWTVGLFLAVCWLDNFLHGDRRTPLILVAGAWMAAFSAVALAEEVA
jgi:hypothetical protein